MTHFQWGLAFGAAYIVTAAVVFGFLHRRWGGDGPDGLVPIVGSVGWPVVLPLWLAWKALRLLVGLGTAMASGKGGGGRPSHREDRGIPEPASSRQVR